MPATPRQPEPLQPGTLNHVALPTSDPQRAASFYCRVLGFAETPRPSFSFRGSWLLHPDVGVMIHLIHDEHHHPELDGPINTRSSHIAMQTADYDEACRRLQALDVPYVERVLPDYNYRQLFFRDPDGNVLELGEWPPPSEMFAPA